MSTLVDVDELPVLAIKRCISHKREKQGGKDNDRTERAGNQEYAEEDEQ